MISRFNVMAEKLQLKILRELGVPIPTEVEQLANYPLPAEEPVEITQHNINIARLQRKILQGLGNPVPEDTEQLANMSDLD